jgi:ribose-phosphate pyrophosphokinase
MFESLYADTQGYKQMLEHINHEILPKIKQLDYFSLAKTVKPKYRPFITNYIGFPDIETLEKFKKLKGSNILIVDDICSKGGTFYHSAKKLKELGAKEVYLYISHCENSILQGEVLTSGIIERVFTTDSILTEEHDKITILEEE